MTAPPPQWHTYVTYRAFVDATMDGLPQQAYKRFDKLDAALVKGFYKLGQWKSTNKMDFNPDDENDASEYHVRWWENKNTGVRAFGFATPTRFVLKYIVQEQHKRNNKYGANSEYLASWASLDRWVATSANAVDLHPNMQQQWPLET
jgi:hypothetical protein